MALINTAIIDEALLAIKFKRETVQNVPEVLGAADGLMARNVTLKHAEATHIDSNIVTGASSNTPKFLSYILSRLEFEVELGGSGDAVTPPPFGQLLTAAGWDQYIEADHVRYQLADDIGQQDSVTFECQVDDRLHLMVGCKGSSKIIWTEDNRWYAMFSFLGLYTAPTANVFARVDYSAFNRSLLVNEDNVTLCQQKDQDVVTHMIEFDTNIDVARIPAANQALISGTKIRPTLTSEIRMPKFAAWDLDAERDGETEYWTKYAMGSTAGFIGEFDVYSQFINYENLGGTPSKARIEHHPLPDATTSGAVLRFK